MDLIDGSLSFVVCLQNIDIHPVIFSRILFSKFFELGFDQVLEIGFLKAFFSEPASFFNVLWIGVQIENKIWLNKTFISILAPLKIQALCGRIRHTWVGISIAYDVLSLPYRLYYLLFTLPPVHSEQQMNRFIAHAITLLLL